MNLTFSQVQTPEAVEQLARIAHDIWFEYWPERIGAAQTEYMVEQFQTAEAISRDISEHGYEYWLLRDAEGTIVGYTGGAPERAAEGDAAHSAFVEEHYPARYFISKIYLYAEQRGKHYASEVIAFYVKHARALGLPIIYLTVNRENDLAIQAYLAKGFEVVAEEDNDIGEGFTMLDYIMVKPVDGSGTLTP